MKLKDIEDFTEAANMNFSTEIEFNGCDTAALPFWPTDMHVKFTAVYVVLVFTTIASLITLPFTVLLNVLVMLAVKSTRRLQTKSNILLACLAATDLMVALTVQPSYITMEIYFLEGKNINDFCTLEKLSGHVFHVLCAVSLFHLVLISLERYLAIKHTFFYDRHITATRLIIAAAVAWMVALFSKILEFLAITKKSVVFTIHDVLTILSIPVIVAFHVAVYIEVRRHEQHIISQLVSLQAKQDFYKEKKALKTTTFIILTVFLCYLLSIILMISHLVDKMAVNVAYIVSFLAITSSLLNSLMNPLIYSARNRQFRVAFVQLLFRKRLEQAEEIEMRVFRSANSIGCETSRRA